MVGNITFYAFLLFLMCYSLHILFIYLKFSTDIAVNICKNAAAFTFIFSIIMGKLNWLLSLGT